MTAMKASTRAILRSAILVFVLADFATAALAHGAKKIRSTLEDQGYEQIEIKGKSSPFDVHACHNGERFQLHFDYYGKMTEETLLGPCDGQVADAEPNEAPAVSESKPEPVRKSDCRQYVAVIGKTVAVPCSK